MATPVLSKIKKAARHNRITWRYLFNLRPTLSYTFDKHKLSAEGERVLEELNRNGVAITSAEALLGVDSVYEEMAGAVAQLEEELAEELAAARRAANDESIEGHKSFIYELLGDYPVLSPQSVYTRFALQHPMLQIANAYFGMYTQLRHYNVWHTFASKVKARASQLWHRDREDYLILKVFVYLNDVDEGAGPFTYAPGTHLKGSVHQEPGHFMEGVVKRTDDDQMAAVVPREQWVKGVGPRGTIIFADTRGYHRGGLARERDRIMYNCMFTSPASEVRELFGGRRMSALPEDKAQARALQFGA